MTPGQLTAIRQHPKVEDVPDLLAYIERLTTENKRLKLSFGHTEALHTAQSLTALRSSLSALVEDWNGEIAEFATKDDPYYNGVRQCRDDVAHLLTGEP